jgi:hypothetical protein
MSYVRPSALAGTDDFSPGFVDAPETDSIPDGATGDARNAMLLKVERLPNGQQRAIMGKRRGCRVLNATPLSAGAPVDLYTWRRETDAISGTLLARCGGAWSEYNDDGTFSAIAGATGFTGDTGRVQTFNRDAWLYDGVSSKLWDGVTLRDVGFVRPTGSTALGVTAGPGVTGTYSARYTWYDQAHDHSSSASPATADQAYTNEQRVHTKPSGSPAAAVTHWRVWVKKSTDAYFGLVATVPLATATHTEAIVDDARVTLLPGESDNDPPTITPVVVGVHKGHGLAFAADSSTMHVSRQGDIESWPPARQFKVGAEVGEPVRAAVAYGEEFLIQKPTVSFRLVGTGVPFEIDRIDGSFGNVSQEAALEVDGWLYAWDEVNGPYRTNLTTWEGLGDYRLGAVVELVNKDGLAGIRAVHDAEQSLIRWAVPVQGSTRRRMILAYHYGLNAWLPPQTGFEYASLCAYKGPTGQRRLLFGDYWGRVYAMDEGHRDGVASGTMRGTLTAATGSTLTDSGAAFLTTGGGLAGVPVAVRAAATGRWLWRRIASNTGTVLTLDTTHASGFSTPPSVGDTYVVGGIEWYWTTPFFHFGHPFRQKRLHWMFFDFKPTGTHSIDVRVRFDQAQTVSVSQSFAPGALEGLWGSMVWGVSLWGAAGSIGRKARIGRACVTAQFRFENYYPDEPVEIARYAIEGDVLPNRRVGG